MFRPDHRQTDPTSKTDTAASVKTAPAPVPPTNGGSAGSAASIGTAPPAAARPLPPPPVRTLTADDIPGATAAATPRPLVDEAEVDAEKVFSPSFESRGTAVFFHAETAAGSALKRAERGENGVLHVATIADDKAKNYHVRLSPDGRAIAFDSDRDGVRGIYVARADGTDVRRVSGDGFAAVPSWSPDGGRLAFLRDEQGRPDVWNLWTLDLASGATVRHTNHRYGQVWGGAWFPDGRRLAYSHEDRLLILDLVSGRTTRYDSPRKGRLVRTPAVSPDGRWVIFQVHRDGGWLLEVANGEMRRILDDASAEEFAWSPDGRQVAFHSRRSGQWSLWQMASR